MVLLVLSDVFIHLTFARRAATESPHFVRSFVRLALTRSVNLLTVTMVLTVSSSAPTGFICFETIACHPSTGLYTILLAIWDVAPRLRIATTLSRLLASNHRHHWRLLGHTCRHNLLLLLVNESLLLSHLHLKLLNGG